MSDNRKRPELGTKEFDEWLKSVADEMFKNGPSDFDERGILSGGPETIRKSDAEAFPDELEEHTPKDAVKRSRFIKAIQKRRKKTEVVVAPAPPCTPLASVYVSQHGHPELAEH